MAGVVIVVLVAVWLVVVVIDLFMFEVDGVLCCELASLMYTNKLLHHHTACNKSHHASEQAERAGTAETQASAHHQHPPPQRLPLLPRPSTPPSQGIQSFVGPRDELFCLLFTILLQVGFQLN